MEEGKQRPFGKASNEEAKEGQQQKQNINIGWMALRCLWLQQQQRASNDLSLIHISEPTRRA